MFRLLTFLLLTGLFGNGAFAQSVELFSVAEDNQSRRNVLEGVLTDGVILDLDANALRSISRSRSNTLTLTLPTGERGSITLQLETVKLLTDDFRVTSPQGVVDYTPGLYYRGTIDGQPNSAVALSLFDDEVIAVMSQPNTGNMVLGQILSNRRNPQYVLYEEQDLIPEPNFECGTEDFEVTNEHRQLMDQIMAGQHQGRNSSNCVRVYLECEYDLVQEKGGATGAVNFMTGLFNVVSLLYSAESINTEVSEIFTWTTPDSYPTNSTSNALNAFRSARPSYNGDLAHLVSRGAPSNGGVAWVNALCSTYGYAYSWISSNYNSLPTYSWAVSVLTHEMGHNLGSPHTHACAWNGNNTAIDGCGPQAGANEGCTAPLPTAGGTIMSYCHLLSNVGIDFNNGFGQQPGDLIRARVAAASCLSACAGGGCGTTVSVTTTAPNCNGGSNASATATATGGQSPYTYAWSNGATGATLNNVTAGNYTVSVTDATGCVQTATAAINNPAAISVSTSKVNASGGNANGSATASANGGAGSFTYTWSNGATDATITGLAPGTYGVTATDANGCTGTGSAVITDPTAGCNANSVELSITFDGYPGDISWALTNASGATVANGGPYTSGQAAGSTLTQFFCLPNGCYDFTISDSYGDGLCTPYSNNPLGSYSVTNLSTGTVVITGCDFAGGETNNFCVGSVTPLTATASATATSCNGGTDGSVAVTATGGTGNFTYAWNTGATTATVNSLAAGTYTVTVADGNNSTTATATVNQPSAITLTVNGNNPSCNDGTDGAVTANATGGTGAKSFVWSTGNGGGSLSNLGAGTYSVTVTDINGCTATASQTLTAPTALFLTLSTNNTTGGNANGAISATVTGGTPAYSYAWNTGATSAAISNLAAGTYTLTVTDANGCTTVQSATVQGSTSTLTLTATATDASCNGSTDGSASAAANGGAGSYAYAWSNGATGATTNGLAAGTYTVTATDGTQTATASVTVGQPAAIGLTASTEPTSCSDEDDGAIDVSATGGVGTLGYAWSNGATGASVYNLAPGTYTVTATDANGCTATLSATVTSPAALVLNVTSTPAACNGGSNGTATASTTGGTAPYKYTWSNGANGATVTGLSALTYGVTVVDGNGCATTGSVSVGQASGINVIATGTDLSCNGAQDGSATVSAAGGSGSFTYQWSTGSTNATINNLSAGSYVVTVTDGSNCDAITNVVISEPAVLTAAATSTNANGGNNGTAAVSATGGTAPYTYNWSNGTTGATANGLAPGTYTVTVTDANGCTTTAIATVTDVTPPSGCQGTEVNLTFAFDNWPEDISWSLLDANGAAVATGGNYTGSGSSYSEDFCLPNGCYDFVLVDAYGDGLCTPYTGNVLGSYTLTNTTDGSVIATGCDFGAGETVNFCVDNGGGNVGIPLEYGTVAAVDGNWQTINLGTSYVSPVVIATVLTANTGQKPVVTRIRNAAGNSFELKVQNPAGTVTTSYPVYYFVIEEGVYDAATYGVNLEAVRVQSTKTAHKGNWTRETRSYQNSYTNPVVVGQVLTANDTDWSSFWSAGNSQTAPASATAFSAGKHVGEDPDRTRADETVGYVVIESGTGTLDGLGYSAALGSDIVRGQANSATGYTYNVIGLTSIDGVVASGAAMDGGDGGWSVLKSAPANGQLRFAIDEDQAGDTERSHTTEQVGYLAFGTANSSLERPTTVTPSDRAPRYRDEVAELQLSVFPNPTSELLSLTIEGEAASGTTASIIDLSGKQVLPVQPLAENGRLQTLRFDVSGLQPGIYFVRVRTEQNRQTLRFVVAR